MQKALIKLPAEMKQRVIDETKYHFKGDLSRILVLQTGMTTENGSMLNEFQRDPDTEFYQSADIFVVGGYRDSQNNNYTIYGITNGIDADKHQTILVDKDGNETILYKPVDRPTESTELTKETDKNE